MNKRRIIEEKEEDLSKTPHNASAPFPFRHQLGVYLCTHIHSITDSREIDVSWM